MLYDCLQVGDKVVISVDPENRSWGYDPCPDGTIGYVTGFGTVTWARTGNVGYEPGVYENKAYADVALVGQRKVIHLSSHHFALVDQIEWERRVAEYHRERSQRGEGGWRAGAVRLADLPHTLLWEGDRVRVSNSQVQEHMRVMQPGQDPRIVTVVNIDYMHLDTRTSWDMPYPAYEVSHEFGGGWSIALREDEMELLERGNVWKHYHKEPLVFGDITEEANFYRMIGHTEEVRNPANNLYDWTLEQALGAIRSGIGHGVKCAKRHASPEVRVSVVLYRDPEVGARIAQATLEGFEGFQEEM